MIARDSGSALAESSAGSGCKRAKGGQFGMVHGWHHQHVTQEAGEGYVICGSECESKSDRVGIEKGLREVVQKFGTEVGNVEILEVFVV